MRFGQRPVGTLKGLRLTEVDQLRAAGLVRNYRKNEGVYRLGDRADSLHMVLKGRVRLHDIDRDGADIICAFAAEGEGFGWEVLAEKPRRELSATAAETSEILTVESPRLQQLLERNPGLGQHLLRQLAALVVHDTERTKMLAFLDVPSRLAGMILWLADRYGERREDGLEVPYWFTHQELADLIGSTRETVTTVLAEFKRSGLVVSRNHHFVVLDRQALATRIRLPDFGTEVGEERASSGAGIPQGSWYDDREPRT